MKKSAQVPHTWNRNLYYLQPNGFWVKGADGRGAGKTLAQLQKMRAPVKKK